MARKKKEITPEASTPPKPTKKVIYRYMVVRGETLEVIGARYGVEPEQIARDNNISVTDTLQPGQALKITKIVGGN